MRTPRIRVLRPTHGTSAISSPATQPEAPATATPTRSRSGGLPGPGWGPADSYGGDVGQVARGVVVKAKNAGTSVARLGAMVSEGIGEGGGLVFGLDTNDANRVSSSRPASGVLELSGKLCLSGEAASTTATPSNVAGKVPIYTSSGTLIGYILRLREPLIMSYPTYRQDFEGGTTLGDGLPRARGHRRRVCDRFQRQPCADRYPRAQDRRARQQSHDYQ